MVNAVVAARRRGGFVGDHQFRLADQGTGGGDALLRADGEFAGRASGQIGIAQPQGTEQGQGRTLRIAMPRRGALAAQRREPAGQQDVVQDREKGQQIELLEEKTRVVDAKTVTPGGGERSQVLTEQPYLAATGALHAAEQAEQGGLAAARRAFEKQCLAGCQLEVPDVQAFRLARPGEAEVLDLDQGGGDHDRPTTSAAVAGRSVRRPAGRWRRWPGPRRCDCWGSGRTSRRDPGWRVRLACCS